MASFGRGGGGRGGGGRHHHSNRFHGSNNNNNNNNTQQQQQQPKLQVCRNYIATGSCPHGSRCNFSHVIRHYATVDVSDKLPPSSSSSSGYHHHNNRNAIKDRFKATSIAIWETSCTSSTGGSGSGGIKLFVSSQDGKWRLYNTTTTTSTNQHQHNPHSTPHLEMNNNNNNTNTTGAPALVLSLQQEFEHYVGGPIETLHLLSNTFLFVGFEISSPIEAPLENNKAGMIHVWNLGRPSDAPLECMMHGSFAKYASSGKVRCLCTTTTTIGNSTPTTTTTTAGTTTSGGGILPRVWSGGNDGVIREWSVAPPHGSAVGGGGFVLVRSMSGHLGAVTKLTLSNNNGNVLWSGGVDGTIRLWNVDNGNHGEMAYLIPAVKKETTAAGAAAMDPTTAAAAGHSAAITGLLPFEIPSSSSNPTTTGGSVSAGSSTTNASCFIFSSSLDETVKVWNATNGSCVASERHGQGVTSIAFTTDASRTHPMLLCGLYYGDIMIRGTISNPPLCLLLKISHNFVGVGHELGPVHDIQAGPGCTFYAVGEDGKLTVWQIVGDFGL